MGLKDCSKSLSKLVTQSKLVFEWGESATHKSNVIKTVDLRCDVHKDLTYPGYAIAKIQVNKDAKDSGAKEFLRKGNKGAHKTTHKTLAEIRFSQDNFNEAEFKSQVQDAWKTSSAGPSSVDTGETSASGGGESSASGGQVATGQPAWEWDDGLKMNRYFDGTWWVYWDTVAQREKYWDGTNWQWKV